MTNHTETQLSSMTIVEIVALYNEFAAITGDSPVKRFSSKPAAIKRTLEIQEAAAPYMDAEPTEAKEDKTEEPTKTKEDKAGAPTKGQQVVSIANKPNFRKGSIGEMMFGHIECNEGITLQELVDYMVANYKKPRADSAVDAPFITSTVRYFVRKGALEIK